ncbi:MAG: hypothetical protein ACTH8F_05790 [Microbacterium sp.]|uniref:hypothetical protein n=1 Tax=Microbacterium sp. TaxID=51671 RepID=UPI003F995827
MEQRPIPGQEPLAHPTADVAQAYLDEIGSVVQRREEFIDRRRMARLAGVEAIVLAAYLTIMMFSFGHSVSTPFLMLISLFGVWLQLSAELKESYGGQPRLSGTSQRIYLVFGLLAVAAVMVGVWLQIAGVEVPVWARFIPGVALLAGFGGRAVRDLRRAPEVLPNEHDPFTRGARYATACLGLVFGLGAWVVATSDTMFSVVLFFVVMVGIFGWGIAAYATSRLPALGAIWQWPQWTAFALGSAVLIAVMLFAMHTDLMTVPLAISLGVGVALLFAVVAFVGGCNGQ